MKGEPQDELVDFEADGDEDKGGDSKDGESSPKDKEVKDVKDHDKDTGFDDGGDRRERRDRSRDRGKGDRRRSRSGSREPKAKREPTIAKDVVDELFLRHSRSCALSRAAASRSTVPSSTTACARTCLTMPLPERSTSGSATSLRR